MSQGAVLVPRVIGALDEATSLLRATRKRRLKLPSDPTDARRPAYLKAILAQDWSALEARGLREAKSRQRTRPELIKELRAVVRAAELVSGVEPAAKIARNVAPIGFPQPLLDKVRLRLTSRGMSGSEAGSLLRPLSTLDLPAGVAVMEGQVQAELALIDQIARQHLRSTVGGLLAISVAAFNLRSPAQVDGEEARSACTEIQSSLRRITKHVYESLRANDRAGAMAWATELGAVAQEALRGRLFADAAGLSDADLPRSPNERAAAIECGAALHSCLFAVVLSLRLTWVLRFPLSFASSRSWFRAAGTLPFENRPGAVPKVRIAELAGQPSARDGVLLTVGGELGPVTIEHRGRKVVSWAVLRDEKGQAITLVLPHLKLDSGGLVAGTAVEATGVWGSASREVNGPALQLDRINYGELAKASFLGWVAREIRPFYEPSPHGLNVRWSWKRGVDGAPNPIRYGTWYGG